MEEGSHGSKWMNYSQIKMEENTPKPRSCIIYLRKRDTFVEQ